MGWISVKDDLPDPDTIVIASDGERCFLWHIDDYENGETFLDFEGITHWMPLPEPPR